MPMPREVELPKVAAFTLAVTVAVVHDVEPANALALELLPDWKYVLDGTDQLPPEVVQPLALPSLKSSAKRVAAFATAPKVKTSVVTATATPASRATRVRLPGLAGTDC